MIKEKIAVALACLLIGCELKEKSSNSIPDLISADNPRLEQIAETQAFILEDIFDVKPVGHHSLITMPSANAQGMFYYQGILWYGAYEPGTIRVSDMYHEGVIRHELLHAAGKEHYDQVINGINVSEHVDAWH